MDSARFEGEIRPAGQPAVIRGLATDWPAVRAGRQSAEVMIGYLKRFATPEPVHAIVGPPEIEKRFFYTPDLKALNFTRGLSPLAPFLDRLLRDQAAERPYAMAVQSAPVTELLPGFAEENINSLVAVKVKARMWLGNAIQVATHADLMENVGIVVAGRRRFTVFPPDQIANLYIGPMELTPAGTPVSLVDHNSPDLDRFPRYAEALEHAQVAELEPGDAVYLPFHWWHAVDSLAPVNAFVNYWWNDRPEGMGNPYDALIYGLFALAPLSPDQRAVWRTLFDHFVFRIGGDPMDHVPPDLRGILGAPDRAHFERVRLTLLESLTGSGGSS